VNINMKQVYYNQNYYAAYTYPSKSKPDATIKSSGCGVCCAAMIVENLTGKRFPPPVAVAFALAHKARSETGTDMKVLAPQIAKVFGLEYTRTNDEQLLLNHLQKGGLAIANVGGNRKGWTGVFSDRGHYVVVAGINRNMMVVLDPGYYRGKFNKPGRTGKVEVKGNECLCDISILSGDTANRTPAYYLFNKKGEKAMVNDEKTSSWAKEAQAWVKEHNISDSSNPQGTITREEVWVMLYRLAQKFNK
jgi:hypothetical protein